MSEKIKSIRVDTLEKVILNYQEGTIDPELVNGPVTVNFKQLTYDESLKQWTPPFEPHKKQSDIEVTNVYSGIYFGLITRQQYNNFLKQDMLSNIGKTLYLDLNIALCRTETPPEAKSFNGQV